MISMTCKGIFEESMVYYSVDFLKYDIRYFRSRLCLRTATESLPVRRERIPRRPRYATNLKFEWDDGRRDSSSPCAPRLKRLGGQEVITTFEHFGFSVISRRESHVKLRRLWQGQKQTLTIAAHQELDPGTWSAIFRQACRYIDPEVLKPFFYFE
jgi:predicted RNA binding protein YcfA (HicA-like mRNA interferase family)